MKLSTKGTLLGAVAAILVGVSPAVAQVGLTSSLATVNINATKSSVLSLLINSGGTQTLASLTDNTTNNFASPVNVTTTWDLNAGSNVVLVGSFATPAQALASGANFITTQYIKGRVTTGTPTSYTAFTQAGVGTIGTAGGSLTLFTQSTASLAGNRTDNLDLQIDLTGHANLIPGTYTGTLNLQAIVQ
ncbi:MAG TPA: hypothetical protein VL287_16295 [Gemmatimonadales bacterium]|jgi:hypothetical protein|nr:hypothetical protein [Gemmatimonadales bacterium]